MDSRSRPHHRAEVVEAEVWEEVSSLLKEPEHLRIGIERYIEQEHRGDPEREMRVWPSGLPTWTLSGLATKIWRPRAS